MKYFPQILIGLSALFALFALVFYFLQTSPEATDQAQQSITVVNETPQPAPVEEATDNKENSESTPEEEVKEASLAAEGLGINLARIRPDGSAIVAGNALPGSTINLMKDGQVIGSAVASDQGEWVIIPDELLGQGSHLLSLEIINPDGRKEIGDMALAIQMINDKETPLVALVPYTEDANQAATLLQVPETLEAVEVSEAAPETTTTETEASTIAATDAKASVVAVLPRVTIRSIQALNSKTISVSGIAEGGTEDGASVELLLNGQKAAETQPNDNAMYAMMVPIDPDQDQFRLKSILRDGNGNPIASASIKLSKSQMAEGLDGNALIVVQKGDALWRIAYKTYGAGIRYVDIVRQNSTKINDPDLIYPDQIFVIPNG